MYKRCLSAVKRLFFVLLLVACALAGRAQIYPVQVSIQVLPPYSVYLPDYASPGGEKLRLVLLQRDLTVQGYRIRFDMKVQVNGITIMQTSKSAVPPPIILQPGIPTVLGGSDLSWYVQPQNLEFGGGYSSSTYEQSRSLPEGPITITFTAYDYVRSDVQVSAHATSFFYATRDNPPLLNYPACGMQVIPISPQFLNFSWLPQNTSSPNSALQTNYIFSLWAVLPAGYNFQDIVQSTRPLYSVTTQAPTLVYGPGEPLLVPGQTYAWRVQAVDASGRDLFRNNGYSETCSFIYSGDGSQGIVNYPAIQINAASAGPAQGKIWWTVAGEGPGVPGTGGLAASGYDQYRLYYRKTQGNYDWFSVDVNDSMYRVFDLEPSTTYECRLQGHKAGSYGPYTDVVNFTTAAPKTVGCTDNTSMLSPYSGRPLAVATGGMKVNYGPWDVQLLTVQALGAQGQFKGTCKVTVPFMGGVSFNAKFDNLTIDDSRNVTAGNIEFLSQGMKSWIDSSISNQMGGSLYGKVVSGSDTTNVTAPRSLADLTQLPVTLGPDSTIVSFTIPGQPPIVVTVNDSLREVTIKDSTGSTYALDNQGHLTQLTFADASLTGFFASPANVASLDALATGKGVVNFTDADAKYAFDSWKPFYAQGSTILTSQYEKLDGGSGDYYVSQKAIGAGESDIVGVSFRLADGMTGDSVVFATKKGERLIWDPKDSTLNLLGGPAADAQEVYALYPKPGGGYYSLGKLLVSAYEHKDFTVVVVPVVAGDGVTPPVDRQQYEDALNNVYNKVNVSWKVVLDSVYNNTSWDTNNDGLLTMNGSSFFSNALTGEPAALVRAYKNQRGMDKGKQYIYILNASGNKTGDQGDLLGDMPRVTQYGFIFLGAHTGRQGPSTTLAHELGHGQFNLEHTFSADIALGGQGATSDYPNLMDYVGGDDRHLYKYQWNQVHQPGQVMGIFESDTAGESLEKPYLRCVHDDNIITGLGKKFYDPVGNVIQLDDDLTPYAFFGSREGAIYGNLAAFKKGGQTYIYYLYASGSKAGEYGGFYGTIDGTAKKVVPTIVHDVATSVKIDNTNHLNGMLLTSCFCSDLVKVTKPNEQVKIDDKTTGKIKVADSKATDSAGIAGQDILLCADDPFNQRHTYVVQDADGTRTWGQTIVRQLNAAVDGNKVNSYGNNLLTTNFNGISYIFTGSDSRGNDVFQSGYTLDELNNKMALLEISKGYQFYTRFIQISCTFPQQAADNFARKILDSSNVSKEKGIICLVLYNGDASTGDPQQFTIGLAFGTGVKEGADIRNILNATPTDVRKNMIGSLINAYQAIPKKRIVYSYFINQISQWRVDEYNALVQAQKTYGMLKDTIRGEMDSVTNEAGNSIGAEYYIKDSTGKIISQIVDNGKALKEEYVTDESRNVALEYAIKYAGWNLHSWQGRMDGDGEEHVDNAEPSVSPCHFTLGKPCSQELMGQAFFIATLVVPQRYMFIPIGAAVIYYVNLGQTDEAGLYLAFYGLSELFIPALEYAAYKSYSLVKLGTKKLKDLGIAMQFRLVTAKGLSEDAMKALFEKQLSSTCAEYFIPYEQTKNLWIKVETDASGHTNKVLVGSVSNGNLEVMGYQEGTTYILESPSTQNLKDIAEKVMGTAITKTYGLVTKDVVATLLPKDFVKALQDFGKTEDQIYEYFMNYHNNRSGQQFFNSIEYYLSKNNTANLTRGEAYALWGYTTHFFFRDLNAWLRAAANTTQTGEITALINSALDKMPVFGGQYLYRGIKIGAGELEAFKAAYGLGKVQSFPAFTSCGGSKAASFVGRAEENVIFEIEHLNGKDISDFADGIKYAGMAKPEILLKPGSEFTVTGAPDFDNEIQKWVIKLKQTK